MFEEFEEFLRCARWKGWKGLKGLKCLKGFALCAFEGFEGFEGFEEFEMFQGLFKELTPVPSLCTSSALRAPSPQGEGKRYFCLFERGDLLRWILILSAFLSALSASVVNLVFSVLKELTPVLSF